MVLTTRVPATRIEEKATIVLEAVRANTDSEEGDVHRGENGVSLPSSARFYPNRSETDKIGNVRVSEARYFEECTICTHHVDDWKELKVEAGAVVAWFMM